MKNLKKVLALVLAFACAFTMFAGAAFTDEADIETLDSVNTLVALGVIGGYPDGSFQPDATVTRAEMAKMIYVIRTGRSDASAYNDDATTFTDISSHWARGYIKYCQSLGVISGKSATIFDPNATVTTQEAAKMLHVTLGYNAERAGLVGAGWGNKTTALADENGLLEDVNCGTTQGMPRQFAAQLIYNAIFTPTVVYRDGEYTNMSTVTGIGNDYNPTIGVKYMDLVEFDGMLTAIDYNEDKDEYTYTITPDKGDAEDFATSADFSELFAMNVNALYKVVNGKTTVYGIYAQDSAVMVESTVSKIDDLANIKEGTTEKVKIDGTEYKIDKDITGYEFCGNKIDSLAAFKAKYGSAMQAFTFKGIDNDDNSKIDTLVVYPVTVAKITYVNNTSIRVGATEYKFEDHTIYDGAKKDDWVVITPATGASKDKANVVKADIVSGKVSSVKTSGDNTSEVRVDGVWYKSAVANDKTAISSDVDLVVYNGVYFHVEGSTTSLDVAVVTGVGNYDAMNKTKDVRLMFTDGKEEIVPVEKWNNKTADQFTGKVNYLVSYEIDDDKYSLTTITDSKIGSTEYTGMANKTAKYLKDKAAVEISGTQYDVADDAAVIIYNSDDDKYVYMTGADLLARNSFDLTGSYAAYKDNQLKVFFGQTTATVTSGDTQYGYIVDSYVALNADDKEKVYIDVIVDGEKREDVETNKSKSELTTFVKGTVISYTMDGDVMAITKEASVSTKAAIKEFNDSRVLFYKTGDITKTDRYLLTEDTVIIAIDSDDADNVLYAGNSLMAANAKTFDGSGAATAYYNNALFEVNGDGEIEVIFVEVASDAEF